MRSNKYEAIIGLEVHFELLTKTKIFCSCASSFGKSPNTLCCPVCTGHPGALPTLNARAVEFAIMAGIATHCTVSEVSAFDRKNYFYPDLPKGYQITQFFRPIATGGYLEIEQNGKMKRIRIKQMHLEEDAGKLVHDKDRGTLVDFNRAGVPLIEVVSEPDIRTSDEAKEYLRALRSVFLYLGISDGKMNEGSMRCDVNISVRERGSEGLGTRTEIKNINSFSFVGKAIEYEFQRQTELLEAGEKIVQETRRYNEKDGRTYPMRSKEESQDYRYFPEPDIPPVVVSQEDIEKVRATLPKLADERKKEYIEELSLTKNEASVLVSDKKLSDYFDACARHTKNHHTLANIILGELQALVTGEEFECGIAPLHMSSLADMRAEKRISSSCAKKLLAKMFESDFEPISYVSENSLWQISDEHTVEGFVREAILALPEAVSDYKRGKDFASKTIIGRAISLSGGRADPELTSSLTKKILNE